MKLPDYITTLNLASGLLAILAAIDHHYGWAAVLIVAGAFFDAMDGFVARRLHIESSFGAELDSLSDLVTFGVAPMVLASVYYGTAWLSVVALLLPLAGALRLARHNVTRHATKGYLIGVPITTSGVVVPLLIALSASIQIAGVVIGLLSVLFLGKFRVNKLLK